MIIKELRLQKGWSQEHLSALSGLSTRTIQRIERGASASLESLLSLAAALEVDVSTLQQSKTAEDGQTSQPKSLYKFYLHLAKFILIVPVLFVVNTINNPDYIWAWWVLLGWGVGISIHAIKIFGRNIFLIK